MQYFLISAVLAFFVVTLVFAAQVYGNRLELGFGDAANISLSMPLAISIALVIGVLLVVFIVVVAVGPVHPSKSSVFIAWDFLASRPLQKAVFGAVFGVIAALWFQRILAKSQTDPMSAVEKVQLTALILFFLVGVADKHFLRLIDRMAGVETPFGKVQFAASQNAGQKTRSRSQQSPAPLKVSTKLPGEHLQGDLLYLSLLDQVIDLDKRYVETLVSREALAGLQLEKSDRFRDFIKLHIKPLAQCLGAVIERTSDTAYAHSLLSPLPVLLERLKWGAPENPPAERDVAVALETASLTTARRAQTLIAIDQNEGSGQWSPPGSQLYDPCGELIDLYCRDGGSGYRSPLSPPESNPINVLQNIKHRDCLEKSNLMSARRRENASAALSAIVGDSTRFDRPYQAIAYAHVMSFLGEELAGAAEIDRWLRHHEGTDPLGQPPLERTWLRIRARIHQAAIMESYLDSGKPVSKGLQDYYIQTLEETGRELRRFGSVDEIIKAMIRNGQPSAFERPEDFPQSFVKMNSDGKCDVGIPQFVGDTMFAAAKRKLILSNVLIYINSINNIVTRSAEWGFMSADLQPSLLNDLPDVSELSDHLNFLLSIDFDCFDELRESGDLLLRTKGSVLLAYAKLSLAMALRKESFGEDAPNVRRAELKKAEAAIKQVHKFLDDPYKTERKKPKSFFQAIEETALSHLQGATLETARDVRAVTSEAEFDED